MAYTETVTESFGNRIGGSLRGILIGILLILVAIVGLFWNEGRTVNRYKTLKEGSKVVVSVSADKVDPLNEGKLVHLSGKTASKEILCDNDFGIAINAVMLTRHVEMFQWIENSSTKTQKNLGGSEEKVTVYTYKKEWSSSLNDSSSYKEKGHDNPSVMPYQAQTSFAKDVNVGAFKLSSSLISLLGPAETFKVEDPNKKIPEIKSPETKSPEIKSPEIKSPEIKSPETKSSEIKSPETKSPETKSPETKSPETKSSEIKSSEIKSQEIKKSSVDAVNSDIENLNAVKKTSINFAEENKIRLVSYVGEETKTISVSSEKTSDPNSGASSFTMNNNSSVSVSSTAEKSATDTAISVQGDDQKNVSNETLNNDSAMKPRFVQGMIYFGKNPVTPEIGDVRITYDVVYPNKDVSIISRQKDSSFVPYTAKKGKIELLENSIQTAESMFSTAQSNNNILAWVFRLAGFIVLFIGISSVLRPLAVMADLLPFLGNLVGAGTSIVSFMVSLVISLITIGIAWLFYRPFVGIPLLLVAVYFLYVLFKKKKSAVKE